MARVIKAVLSIRGITGGLCLISRIKQDINQGTAEEIQVVGLALIVFGTTKNLDCLYLLAYVS